MAVNKHVIKIVTEGAEKSKKQVNGINKSLKSMALRAAAVTGAFYGARGLINGMQQFAQQATNVRRLETGFNSLGKQIGFNAGSFSKLDRAVNGTVTQMELMTKANNAMFLGVVKSDDEMAELFDTAQRLGQALGLTTTQAIDSMVTGMGRQSKLMLDNLGIIVDTTAAYKTFAAELGVNVNQLTESQKKQAFNNATLAEAKRLVDGLGAETEDAAMIFEQFETASSKASIALGEALVPITTKITSLMTQAANKATEFFNSFAQTPLEKTISDMKELGLDTTDLELTLNSLNQNKALEQVSERFEKEGMAQKILNHELASRNFFLQEQAKIMQEITKLTNDEMTIRELGNKLEEEGADRSEINAARRLERQLEYNRERLKQTDAEIAEAEEQLQVQAILQKLRKERAVLEDTTNKKKLKGTQEEIDKQKELGALDKILSSESAKVAIDGAAGGAKANLIKQIMAAIPFPLNLAVSASAGKFIDNIFAKNSIKKAQYGADFITSGPQMMMVGEGSGPERVQVTPLTDPNIDGPQGQGITLNISGNVLHESFVEDNVIPQIREGLRLGENIGI